jgi:hypothetical protein
MAGLIVPSVQKAKLDAAKATTTKVGTPAVIAKPAPSFSQTLNLYGTPASGGYSGIPLTPAKPATNKAPAVGKTTGSTNDFIPGYTPPDTTGGGGGGDVAGGGFPAAGTLAGYEVSGDKKTRRPRYNDGKGGFYYGAFEANPDYKKEVTPNAAYDTIGNILESYGITGLASVLSAIRDEYPEARSDELLSLLQFDPRYNTKFNERFAGNVARQKAGLSVLSPGEYLKTEESYKKVFTAYGLTKFNNQGYYDKFITNDVSATELTDRVQLAYDRVLSDDPVNTAFKKFYPSLGLGDIVTAMLDPVNQLPDLERKVKAAEIGGAALRQGFTNISQTATDMTVGADVLAQQGLTKSQAEVGYKTIAQELPQAEKFSSIYAGQSEKYGMLEAEKDTLQGLASEERKKKALIALEQAQFGGDSGTSKASINTNYLNKTSGAGQF